jgi:hypothetical protein
VTRVRYLPGAILAGSDEGEMDALGHESVSSGNRVQDRGKFFEGDIHRCTAPLAHQMLMIGFFGKMVYPGAVTQMNVVEVAEFLQDVECSIHGRLVDPNPGPRPGSFEYVRGAHVFLMRRRENLTDRPAGLGYAKRTILEGLDEIVGGRVHGLNRRMRVAGFAR